MGLRAQRGCYSDGVQGARPNHFPCGELGGHQLSAQWPVRWREQAAAEHTLLRQRDLGTPPMTSATQTPELSPGRPTQAHWLCSSSSSSLGWVRGPWNVSCPSSWLAGYPCWAPVSQGPAAQPLVPWGSQPLPCTKACCPTPSWALGGGGALRKWWGVGLAPSTQRVLAQHLCFPCRPPTRPGAAVVFPNRPTRLPSPSSAPGQGLWHRGLLGPGCSSCPFSGDPWRWVVGSCVGSCGVLIGLTLQSHHLWRRGLLQRPPLALSAAKLCRLSFL